MLERESIIMNAARNPRTAVALVGTMSAIALSGCFGVGEKNEASDSASNPIVACDVNVLDNLSANPNEFTSTAFLPKAVEGINDPTEAEAYVNGNPMVDMDKIDPASLAALMSAVTTPASDKKVADASYDYVESFHRSLDQYAVKEGGLEKAQIDCEATVNTLKQTAEYNSNWAEQGEKVVRLTAVRSRNGTNVIKDMKLEKAPALQTLSGVEVKLRDTSSEDLDGFTSVLVTPEGEMYVKGVTVEKQAKADKQEKDNKGKSAKNGKARGQSQTGVNGGGGSGQNGGTGGGKGGKEGGGCGGSCGSGDNGGNGGNGGGGCSTCGGGGGGGNPTPTPTPGNPPGGGGGGEPTPEPTPEPEPNPNPKGDDGGNPAGTPP